MTTSRFLHACVWALTIASASALQLETDNLRLVLYEGNGGFGRIGHLYDKRTGYDYASQTRSRTLWLIECRRTDDYAKRKVIEPTLRSSGSGLSLSCTKIENGLQLEYTGFADYLEKVVCRIVADSGENGKLRWYISACPKSGWATYEIDYPSLALAECLGESAEDDCTHSGTVKGGVNRNPCDLKREYWKNRHYATNPGHLSSPYACFFDPKGGLYSAAEDAEGCFKGVLVDRWWVDKKKDGTIIRHGDFLMEWRHFEFSEKEYAVPYPVVMRSFGGTNGEATDWRDAADIYREWIKDKRWYQTKMVDRKDLPAWIKNGPAKFKLNRAWYSHKGLVQRWIKEYREKRFPSVPFIIQTEGWEHHGDWITPEYFPCYPSDDEFRKNVADLKAANCHVWAWPGGHHWNVRVGSRLDGSYNLDYTDKFEREVKDHCCANPDGTARLDNVSWLGGGASATLCPATEYGRNWWNEYVCKGLVERGVELVQADQDVGAQVRACWSRRHPHSPGDGKWMYDAMRRQFETQLELTRKIDPSSQFSFEECNELFNDIGCIWDYRNCRFFGSDWASVFNYLHHEFVSVYQPGSELWDKWHWVAHSAADGQVPSFPETPEWYFEMPVISNGSFENPRLGVVGFTGWNAGRDMATVVTDDATDGRYSLGVVSPPETSATNGMVQVWTPLSKWIWQRYGNTALRVSADVKVRKSAGMAHVGAVGQMSAGVFGRTFLKDSPGVWKRIVMDISIPQDYKYDTVRLVFSAYGGADYLVDNVVLEYRDGEGVYKPVTWKREGEQLAFAERWVDLFHANAKWLQHGRHLHPPKMECEREIVKELFRGCRCDLDRPCVYVGAFRASDGTEALFFVNATDRNQSFHYAWHGKPFADSLPPHGMKLVEH